MMRMLEANTELLLATVLDEDVADSTIKQILKRNQLAQESASILCPHAQV